jgi:hypothetical protein
MMYSRTAPDSASKTSPSVMTGAVPMKRFVVCWRQHRYGISPIALELVRNRQFLAKPDDAFGLRLAEMMNNEHGYTCEDYQREQIWRKTAIRSNPEIPRSPSWWQGHTLLHTNADL